MAIDTEVETRDGSRRGSVVAVSAAVAFVLILGGGVLWLRSQHQDKASASDRGSLTAAQYATAVAVAKAEIAREARNGSQSPNVTQAAATVVTGRVQQTNLPGRCDSGQLLVVRLLGDFPGIAIGGGQDVPGGAPTGPDEWVTVKADASSGDACLMGVSLGTFRPPPGSADLTPAL